MFGSRTRPTAARLLLAVIALPLLGWALIKTSIGAWAAEANIGMGEENDLSYGSTFFDWHGNFGLRDARLVHALPDGSEVVFLVDRVTVHPPGFWWLARNAWFHASKDMPDSVSLTLENARNQADADDTPGNYSNLPFDSTGCGEKQLTPADYVTMGLPRPARNTTITVTAVDDARSKLRFAMDTPGSGDLAMDFDLDLPRPVKWYEGLARLQAAPVRHIAMTMQDAGFIKARNAYCAARAGIAAPAFADYNARVLAQRLQRTGQGLSAPAWVRYRQFVANGGRVELTTTSERPITLWSFITMDRDHKFRAFPMQLAVDGGPRTPFGFDAASVAMQAATPTDVAAAVDPARATTEPVAIAASRPVPPASPAPVARAAPVAPPAPPAKPVQPAASVAMGYRALEHLVGSHVEVDTRNGTTRRGTLLAYASLMSSLRLDREEGGFVLALPADSITAVRLLADAGPTFQAKSDAQTH